MSVRTIVIALLGLLLFAASSDAQVDTLRQRLPEVESSLVSGVFSDPRTLWYTDQEMPRAHQHNHVGGHVSFMDSAYDISGGADHRGGNGNGNNEFPWNTPAGLDDSRHASLRAIQLPEVDGQMLPVWVFMEERRTFIAPDYSATRMMWRFPRGTNIVEVLFQPDEDGQFWPFVVRLRRRLESSWDTMVLRPVPTVDDLFTWFDFGELPMTSRLRVARHPRGTVFDVTANWQVLPVLDADSVREMLLLPFQDVTGVDWTPGVAEPTSSQDFSLVPRNYAGTIAGNTPESCAECHRHVDSHVKRFDPRRDWYGWIRGSDGIFSFLPVTSDSISTNGFYRPMKLRRDFLDGGYVVFQSRPPRPGFYQSLSQ